MGSSLKVHFLLVDDDFELHAVKMTRKNNAVRNFISTLLLVVMDLKQGQGQVDGFFGVDQSFDIYQLLTRREH
jgi:hypothetical protein